MKKILLPTLVALITSGLPGFAQMGPPPTTVPAGLSKLFGNVTAFTAKCDLRVLDRNEKEKAAMPMDFTLLDGKIRVDLDMTQLKGQGIQPEQAAMIKQMGMDKIISIVRPDKKMTTVIYPGMQACLNMPLPKEQAELAEATAKLDKTALGKETVDGHPCEKNKVTITDANGKTTEALVWNASDLKDFPVQIQMKEKNDTVTLLYKNVQFTKPAASQFEVPTGYTVYNNMQEFNAGMMQKMMGAAGK
jgi:hypothetical protein